MRTLSIVMPAYNEEQTIESIVLEVLKQDYVTELVIVDDHSADGTWSKL